MTEITSLRVTEIDASDRLRAVDPHWVEVLAASIAERGVREPVEVRPKPDGGYRLIAGGHRLAAAQSLGLGEIPARISEVGELEARLIEIDENLFRRELEPLDRAAFLAERQRIYQELHPETARGTAGAKARQGAKLMFSFAEATAKATGMGHSTVKRAVTIHNRLAPEVRRRLAGTKFAAKEGELYALSRHEPEQQARIVEALLRDEAPAGSVAAAAAEIAGKSRPSAEDQQFQKLVNAYRRAPAAVQARFQAWLAEAQRARAA